jgi:biotin carboxyl carrier protein
LTVRYWTQVEGEERHIEVDGDPGDFRARIGDRDVRVDLQIVEGRSSYSLLVDGRSHDVYVSENCEAVHVSVGPHTYRVEVEDARVRAARQATGRDVGASGPETVASVMPGIVREVLVEPGQQVTKGQAMLILEAMKMQNEIRASRDAVVQDVHVASDTVVAKGDALVTLAAAE